MVALLRAQSTSRNELEAAAWNTSVWLVRSREASTWKASGQCDAASLRAGANQSRTEFYDMKKPTKARAKARADAAMSIYIRTKYTNQHGLVKCISCDTVNPISQMHCAHFISRKREMTRFIEQNCHPACPSCNTFHQEEHMRKYTLFMLDSYGRDFVDNLEATSRMICRRKVEDYLQIEAEYKALLRGLE